MNTGRFCADCGSTQVPLFENFCQECYWKIHSLGKLKRDYIEIPLCLICNAVKLSSGWTGSNQVDEIPEILAYAHLKLLQSDEDTISNIFEIDDIPWGNSNPVFQIYYNLTYDGITEFTTHTETFTLTLKLVGGNCSLCIRKKTGSGESTVQFRAKNRNLAPEEEDIATNIAFALVAEKENESPDAYLADVYESYGGLDFSFGNVAIAELFVEKLKKKWIHHTEKNYKLVTEDKDAKRIYQVTFLFKIPEVKVDDYVVFQNDLHRVKQVSAEYISLISMLNHHLITTTDWVDLKAIDPTPYLITKLVVALDSVNESYLLMDLRDYTSEEVNVNRFPNSLNVSNEVNLLVWENQYYLPI